MNEAMSLPTTNAAEIGLTTWAKLPTAPVGRAMQSEHVTRINHAFNQARQMFIARISRWLPLRVHFSARIAAVLAVPAALTIGCGDSSKTTTGTPEPTTNIPTSIGFTPSSDLSVAVGTTLTIAATVFANGQILTGSVVSWSSSNPAIATVTSGIVKGVSPGAVTITASAGDASGRIAVTVTSGRIEPLTSYPADIGVYTGAALYPDTVMGMTLVIHRGATSADSSHAVAYTTQRGQMTQTFWGAAPSAAPQMTLQSASGSVKVSLQGSQVSGTITSARGTGTVALDSDTSSATYTGTLTCDFVLETEGQHHVLTCGDPAYNMTHEDVPIAIRVRGTTGEVVGCLAPFCGLTITGSRFALRIESFFVGALNGTITSTQLFGRAVLPIADSLGYSTTFTVSAQRPASIAPPATAPLDTTTSQNHLSDATIMLKFTGLTSPSNSYNDVCASLTVEGALPEPPAAGAAGDVLGAGDRRVSIGSGYPAYIQNYSLFKVFTVDRAYANRAISYVIQPDTLCYGANPADIHRNRSVQFARQSGTLDLPGSIFDDRVKFPIAFDILPVLADRLP